MAKCVYIVQGEGKGHLSQAISLTEYLEEAGHTVEAVFVGCNPNRPLPGYFTSAFGEKLNCFQSPYFLKTPNRKGIYIGRTILFNLARSLIYLREAKRIRRKIDHIRPELVFNFYDLIGALALRKADQKVRRIGIGHHFFLHLDGYRCRGGSVLHKWLLKIHTSTVMRSCDRILALSFKEVEGGKGIEVIPPLIRREFREITYSPGGRYLVYLLNEGFVYDLINLAKSNPGFTADIFSEVSPGIEMPSGIRLHHPDQDIFRQMMATCRGLITTSGFDTVAEAAYLGIPLAVIPVRNHLEQRCNSRDTEHSGLGVTMETIEPGFEERLKPIDNSAYTRWVDRAGEMLLKMAVE